MTALCAIEYILVTRWRGGKKEGQNRVCTCNTRIRSRQQKVVNLNIRVKLFAMPESGERKCNLTTLVLVKRASETKPVPTEGLRVFSESAQMRLCSALMIY